MSLLTDAHSITIAMKRRKNLMKGSIWGGGWGQFFYFFGGVEIFFLWGDSFFLGPFFLEGVQKLVVKLLGFLSVAIP